MNCYGLKQNKNYKNKYKRSADRESLFSTSSLAIVVIVDLLLFFFFWFVLKEVHLHVVRPSPYFLPCLSVCLAASILTSCYPAGYFELLSFYSCLILYVCIWHSVLLVCVSVSFLPADCQSVTHLSACLSFHLSWVLYLCTCIFVSTLFWF